MTALAVSLGDPAGVGPELICEAWAQGRTGSLPPFFAVGGASLLADAAERRGISLATRGIRHPDEAGAVFSDALPVLGGEDGLYRPGEPDIEGARLALHSLTLATALAVDGIAGGIVTGPVAKSRLAQIGFDHPGQTEFVAQACGIAAQDAVMLLAGPSLRTVPITVHCALSSVPGLLSPELIRSRAEITASGLRQDFGIAQPRLAICALNPHGGEDGKFGDEEARIIQPAIDRLQAQGFAVTGPHSADALFAPHARQSYDVAICMYHDQALIPLKALDFDNGVNMTLGLPIIRTSPDHGTAFGIAGKRIAHPGAMIAAIRMAGEAAILRTGADTAR
jgi:4-hydroxythreonine-4-phosphate dehydrogenase